MAKSLSWPRINFSNRGKKLSPQAVRAVDPCRGLHYFEFLKRCNGGTPTENCFKVLDVFGNPTIAEVKFFYGMTEDGGGRDIRNAVYWYWDYLPRRALPMAEIEIDRDEYDQCLLITFRWGPLYNQVFLLANPHDCDRDNPDDMRGLQRISTSLPQFLKDLKSRQYFYYRAWYKLPVPVDRLKMVADELIKGGVIDHYQHFANIQSRKCGFAGHPEIGFGVWLSHPNERIRSIAAPKPTPSDASVLAIDAYRWIQTDAEKHVKRTLKALKINRIEKIGESRVADHKGPFIPT